MGKYSPGEGDVVWFSGGWKPVDGGKIKREAILLIGPDDDGHSIDERIMEAQLGGRTPNFYITVRAENELHKWNVKVFGGMGREEEENNTWNRMKVWKGMTSEGMITILFLDGERCRHTGSRNESR